MISSSSQILMPVRMSTIIGSFALALFLNFLPWRDLRLVPDFVALVLAFWCVRQPRLVGLGVAWMLGLLSDAGNGVLLGQHALAYSLLAFLSVWLSRRILWFGPMLQSLHIALILLVTHAAVLLVLQHDVYKARAEDTRISIVRVTPNGGMIVDRNGVVIARNYSGYTLEIFPRRVKNMERTIDELSELVDITPRDRARFRKLLQETRNAENLPIRNRLSDEEAAKFAANRYRFEGVEIKARLFRQYPFGDVGSHVLGYLGRINTQDQAKLEEDGVGANYRGTDYIGKAGVEATYEAELHGTTGFEQVEIDAAGRGIRTLSRTASQPGTNLTLTLDMRLQQMAEIAFGERRGALVAIDPASGGILALVSKPGFDPNLFVDGIDPQYWAELNGSIDKPLNNRAISGLYPPGSTIKPYLALAALETGKRTTRATIFDPGYFDFGGRRFPDDQKGGHGTVDMS